MLVGLLVAAVAVPCPVAGHTPNTTAGPTANGLGFDLSSSAQLSSPGHGATVTGNVSFSAPDSTTWIKITNTLSVQSTVTYTYVFEINHGDGITTSASASDQQRLLQPGLPASWQWGPNLSATRTNMASDDFVSDSVARVISNDVGAVSSHAHSWTHQ
jgi:hypothetical protein